MPTTTHYCQCGCGRPVPLAAYTVPNRGYRKGDPLRFYPGHANRRLPEVRRFAQHLSPTPGGCIEYRGATGRGGYGTFSTGSRSDGNHCAVRAHRYAWSLFFGTIPEGFAVLHACDNPACCHIHHLFLGTQAENMLDKARKFRAPAGQLPFGVKRCRSRYQARVKYRRVTHHLGIFDTVEEAHAAALAKKEALHGA